MAAARSLPVSGSFAFGESPFRAKGVLYLGTQSFFDANMAGGFSAFLADIEDPQLREFISQKFLASSLYDVMPVPALIVAEARALRMRLDAYLQHRTRWQAKKDLSGVYGWVIKLAPPEVVVQRLPRVFAQMFEFATAEDVDVHGRHAKTRIRGVPEPLVDWLRIGLSVYTDTALKLAGARKVETAFDTAPESDRAGVKIVTLLIEIAWS